MKLELLGKELVEQVYNSRMVEDFPKDELKLLKVILDAIDAGRYECLGLMDDGELIGYSFLVKLGKDYLVDYIAVYPERRNSGAGGEMVGLLAQRLQDADNIIVEVEDPDFAEDADAKQLQSRRLAFYLRNGCFDTGLKVRTFGVPFRILTLGESAVIGVAESANSAARGSAAASASADTLWELYQSFYREVLPRKMFERNIERIQQ